MATRADEVKVGDTISGMGARPPSAVVKVKRRKRSVKLVFADGHTVYLFNDTMLCVD